MKRFSFCILAMCITTAGTSAYGTDALKTKGIALTEDYTLYKPAASPYFISNSPSHKGKLVNKIDYTQSVSVKDQNGLPNDITIEWAWPSTLAPGNVYSYPFVGYGNAINKYGFSGTRPPTPLPVASISTLTLNHDMSISGDTDNFDVMYDIFLTPRPNDNILLFEIMVVTHTPSYLANWIRSKNRYVYTDASGLKWDVAWQENGDQPIIIFAPQNFQDMLSNTKIDLKTMLQFMVGKGLTGKEYFNGLALGAETQCKRGTLRINTFSVTFK